MKITQAELDAMPEKAKRDPDSLALYQEHDFIDAYALHTKQRIERTGYKCAIGADENNWDSHGELQRDFLISQGLKPSSRLLEIGCGTGRLARKVVPYLDAAKYVGVDISKDGIDVATRLSKEEGWAEKHPLFVVGKSPHGWMFDYVWAFSVFIHLPDSICESVMLRAAASMHKGSRFYWAYVPEPVSWRSGVKQFRHTLKDYKDITTRAGLTFEDVPGWIARAGYEQGRWSGSQRVALSKLA